MHWLIQIWCKQVRVGIDKPKRIPHIFPGGHNSLVTESWQIVVPWHKVLPWNDMSIPSLILISFFAINYLNNIVKYQVLIACFPGHITNNQHNNWRPVIQRVIVTRVCKVMKNINGKQNSTVATKICWWYLIERMHSFAA